MTTRLSDHAKTQSLKQLNGLIDNVCKFMVLPVNDRRRMLDMWNSKFPLDLVTAASTIGIYGMGLGSPLIASSMRIAIDIDGKIYTARIESKDLTPVDSSKFLKGEIQAPLGLSAIVNKRISHEVSTDSTNHRAIEVTRDYLVEHLGSADADALLEWIQSCAKMYPELKSASRTLKDVFKMAKTAGQIKRMVPELMQYIPEKQREAFEEQKRSSTVPFEWAPYDKTKIGDMLLQISKGHLLSNLNRPNLNRDDSDVTVSALDDITWARYCVFSQGGR